MTSLPCPPSWPRCFPGPRPHRVGSGCLPAWLVPRNRSFPRFVLLPYGLMATFCPIPTLGQQLQETPTCPASNSWLCHLGPFSTGQQNTLRSSKQPLPEVNPSHPRNQYTSQTQLNRHQFPAGESEKPVLSWSPPSSP